MKFIRIASIVAIIASGLVVGSSVVASASSVATVPNCHSSQLKVEQGRVGAAMGSIGITGARFKNVSKSACTLRGYPSLQMYDAKGRRIATHIMHGASASVPPIAMKLVTLRPGVTAKFDLGYANQTGYGTATCPTSARVTLTPPNNLVPLGARWHLQPFGGSTIAKLRCGEITVSPVYAVSKATAISLTTVGVVTQCASSAVNIAASTTQYGYRLGTPVKMTASIRNTSSRTCTVVVGQNSPSFLITNIKGVLVWNNCYVNGQPGACRMSLILKTLKAGARYSATAIWDQQTGGQAKPIKAGVYSLTASFSGYKDEKTIRFTLTN